MADERSKAWKFQTDSTAGLKVRENSVQMNGSEQNFIHSNEQCTYINGPVSFVSNPKQNLIAGLWRPQSPFLQMYPSTIVTPIPQLLVDPPIRSTKHLLEGISFFKGFLV